MKPISTKHKIFLLGGLIVIVVFVIVLTTGRHDQTSEPARTNAFAENETAASSMTTSNHIQENIAAVSAQETANPQQDTKPQANTAAAFIAEELAKGKKPNRLIHEKSPYLLRLAQMTDNQDWHQKGAQTIATFAERLQQYPSIMPQMLAALDFQLDKPKQIIIAGVREAADTKKMLREIHSRYLPNKIILLADGGEGQKRLAKYLPFIASLSMQNNKATAYVCENYVCKLPTADIAVMVSLLE